jgi:hypothetical protein
MTHTQTPAPLGDTFECFLSAGKKDQKGREIGYVVGLRDNGADFYAWVQNARSTARDTWHEFGVTQRSKHFSSQSAATGWAYSTARARIAKVKGGAA